MLLKKLKITYVYALSAFLLLLLILLSAAGCSSLQSGDSEKNTENSEYNIDLTAEYNSGDNAVDVVFTNNTGDLTAFYDGERSFYKKSGDGWEAVEEITYSDVSTERSLSPKEGENTLEYSYAAYPATNDDGNSINEAKNKKYFDLGEYKIVVPITVCDPTEFSETEDENGEKTQIALSSKNRVET